ncbi:TPA: hypothetical protein N0F65_012880, partial [Lagenidium giganteum]
WWEATETKAPMTPDTAVTTPTSQCQCGQGAIKFCQGCDLAYCESCCSKRHLKGAFQRHTIEDLLVKDTAGVQQPEVHSGNEPASICEECIENKAALWCAACELNYCDSCSKEVHKAGRMQSHLNDGQFQYLSSPTGCKGAHRSELGKQNSLENTDDDDAGVLKTHSLSPPSVAPNSPSNSDVSKAVGEIRDTETATSAQDGIGIKPDEQPVSPVDKDSEDEGYDPWSTWNARTFNERSASIDSAPQWRNLRSLSIDSKSPSTFTDEDLHLNLSKPFQSLAFTSPTEDRTRSDSPDMFTQRPRSFSEYSGLHARSSLNSPWHERSHGASSNDQPLYASIAELAKAMKTNFASRHVLVKSSIGSLDTPSVQRISRFLNSFGSLATVREEFAREGLLFFTFYELKAAIASVKTWQNERRSGPTATHSPVKPSTHELISFTLPFELPTETNSATLLVKLQGPAITSNEMRQFCSRFGEVASVLQNDVHSSKYIVEYNDARDLNGAITGLGCAFHSSGPITASRTAPPTLDMAKIQLFLDCVENLSVVAPVLEPMTRPKSYSSSGTSLLTSPTSSTSSPISPSFLESSTSSLDANTGGSGPVRSASPFGGASYSMTGSPLISTLAASSSPPSQELWQNTATTGMASSTTSSGGGTTMQMVRSEALSSALPTAVASGHLRSSYSDPAYLNSYSSSHNSHLANQASSPIYSPYSHPQHSHHHHGQPAMHQRVLLTMGKYPPTRSGSDPCFRSSHSLHLGSSSTSTSHGSSSSSNNNTTSGSSGRNDQGTGEYSLSIEKVASGDDKRTTLMIRNIPNKYTQQMLLAEINASHRGNYDFFYLPIDFKNKCNMGYAFINFMDSAHIIPFYQEFNNQKWTNFNSEKVCAISYARLQGKQAMITRFQNSSLLEKHESYRPLVFVSNGPNRGKPETFPSPKQMHKKMLHPQHHGGMLSNDDYGANASRMYAHSHMQTHHMNQHSLHHIHQVHHHQHQLMSHALHLQQLHGIPAPHTAVPHAMHASPHHLYQDVDTYGSMRGVGSQAHVYSVSNTSTATSSGATATAPVILKSSPSATPQDAAAPAASL